MNSYTPDVEGAPTESPPLEGGDVINEGSSSNVPGSGDNETTMLLDHPTGRWSVRFPSSRNQSLFLHRVAIRLLREALIAGESKLGNTILGGDGVGVVAVESPKPTILPVFLERRQLAQVTREVHQFVHVGRNGQVGMTPVLPSPNG